MDRTSEINLQSYDYETNELSGFHTDTNVTLYYNETLDQYDAVGSYVSSPRFYNCSDKFNCYLEWVSYEPIGTDINMSVSTADMSPLTPDMSTTSQYEVSGEIISSEHDLDNYIKWNATLTTSDTSMSPALYGVAISKPAPPCEIEINNGSVYTNDRLFKIDTNCTYVTYCNYKEGSYEWRGWDYCVKQTNFGVFNESNGNKTIYLRTKDRIGYVSSCQDSIIFDNKKPRINVTWPPAGSLVKGVLDVNFIINETNPVSGLPEISIDGGQYFETDTNARYEWNTSNLTEGAHTIQIKQGDKAGNVGYSSHVNVIVDNTPEPVTILKPLTGNYVSGYTDFEAVAADYVSKVVFSVVNGSGSYSPRGVTGNLADTDGSDGWQTTINTSAFSDGWYNVTVKAYEKVFFLFDNYVAVDTETRIKFDNTPPLKPAKLRVVDDPDRDGKVNISWPESLSPDVVSYNLYRSTEEGFDLSEGNLVGEFKDNSTSQYLPDGTYYYKVTSVDDSGKESLGYAANFTIVDSKKPLGYLDAQPGVVRNTDTILFEYYADDSGYEVQVDTSVIDSAGGSLDLTDPDNDSVYSGEFQVDLSNSRPDGVYTLTAVVNDSLGNMFYPTVNVTLDNTDPSGSIVINNIGETGFQEINPEYTASRMVSLNVSYSDVYGIDSCKYGEGDLSSLPWEDCQSSKSFLLSENEGDKTVNFRVKDNAGNEREVSDSIVLDSTAPFVNITWPPHSSFVNGTFNITFNIDETNPVSSLPQISIDGEGFVSTDGVDYHFMNASNMTQGVHTIQVRQFDLAGNVGYSSQVNVIVDNTPEPVTILKPLTGNYVSGYTDFEAVAADYVSKVVFSVVNGSGSYSPRGVTGNLADTDGSDGWQTTINTSAFSDGWYNVTVKAYEKVFFLFDNYVAVDTETRIKFDNTPPLKPAKLRVVDDPDRDGKVNISWPESLSPDVVSYNLYRSTEEGFDLSEGNLVGEFKDNSTSQYLPDGTYYYKVTSVDDSGKESLGYAANFTIVDSKKPLGYLDAQPGVVRNTDTILFEYYADDSGYEVQVDTSVIDSAGGSLDLTDPDNDSVYSGEFQVDLSNSRPDGVYTLTAVVNDSLGNMFYPTVNVTLDNTDPSGSIVINNIGETGFQEINPEYTASRMVSLNVSYSDVYGIDSCRYGEGNISHVSWQGCQNQASFLLSEEDGMKTIVLQVRDVAGNTHFFNDTIFLNKTGVGLDVTPPKAGYVYDAGNWTNINNSISAEWINFNDRESQMLHIPLEFEVLVKNENGSNLTEWINVGQKSEYKVSNLSLESGERYVYCVKAINSVNMSNFSCSDGIGVDLKGPSVSIMSSTHNKSLSYDALIRTWFTGWENESFVKMFWNGNDSLSGVHGFSFVFDKNNYTEPDKIPEGDNDNFQNKQSHNYSNVSEGIKYFHVRARDVAGNWGQSYHYQIKIDSWLGVPQITFIKPRGFTVEENPELIVHTNEPCDCSFKLETYSGAVCDVSQYNGYKEFDQTRQHKHKTQVDLCNGNFLFRFNCTDRAGLSNTNNLTNFTVNTGLVPGDLQILSINPVNKYTGASLKADVFVTINHTGTQYGLEGLSEDLITRINSNRTTANIFEEGLGMYEIRFEAPLIQGSHTLNVSVRESAGGPSSTAGFVVSDYSLTVKYKNNANLDDVEKKNSIAYSKGGAYIVGVAAEGNDKSLHATNETIWLNQKDTGSNTYLFVTETGGRVGQRDVYLNSSKQEFEDFPLPRFGMPLDDKLTYVSTGLRYPDIVFSGDVGKVGAGRHTMVVRNNGLTEDGRTNITVYFR